MTRPHRMARMIARLTGDSMRKYYIEVTSGKGLYKHFWSYSRNARKHLRDNVPWDGSCARCVVYTSDENGDVVSACGYWEGGTIKYLNW